MADRPVLVYRRRYNFGFPGLARMHPFDMRKFAHAMAHLRQRGALKRGDVVRPRWPDEALLQRVHWRRYLKSVRSSAVLAKIVEVRTPVRLYCHACTGFVPSTQIENDIGQCKTCGSRTCVYCKKKEHQNECPKDKATAKFLRFAKTQEWQRCPSCRTMVEKRYGCHHMSE